MNGPSVKRGARDRSSLWPAASVDALSTRCNWESWHTTFDNWTL